MRHEKTVAIGDSRTAIVRELRLRDVRRLIAELKDDLNNLDLTELFGDKLDQLLNLAGDCIAMPDGETVEDLSFSELDSVIDAFKEVNASFLDKMKALGFNLSLGMRFDTPETSTAAPSDSSSEDTSTAGTTAGNSSAPAST